MKLGGSSAGDSGDGTERDLIVSDGQHGLAVGLLDGGDHAGFGGGDLVHGLHRLDDQDRLTLGDARTDLEDFRSQTGIALSPTDSEQEIETLGGLVVSLLGRVPQRGEIVSHPSGYEFEVLEADPRRVKRLRLRERARRAGAAEKTA